MPKLTRLDYYVSQQLTNQPRTFATKLVTSGRVKVNAQVVTKAGHQLKSTDKVTIIIPKAEVQPKLKIPIIYQDQDCIVINKPAGILVHSKGQFNPEATVASWLGDQVPGLSGKRAGIVHRLDRDTSGVMICAKNDEALKMLQKQFSTRKVKKTYLAIVSGRLAETEAIIDMPIERNPKRPQTFRVGANGKPALTSYKVLKVNGSYSLVELKPTTGRTHQLRVHLKQLGRPIVGDRLYGGQPAKRMYLHASSLELTLPSGARQEFNSPTPKEFKGLI